MPYDPKPIDNSGIDLGPELNQLVETLARNNHDLWAKARMAEGWRYGPQRDNAKRETPLLVAYDDLAESEKRIDRQNAVETLKSIIHFGGRVEAPRASTPPGNDLAALTACARVATLPGGIKNTWTSGPGQTPGASRCWRATSQMRHSAHGLRTAYCYRSRLWLSPAWARLSRPEESSVRSDR